jgi:hypothetical protein
MQDDGGSKKKATGATNANSKREKKQKKTAGQLV